jgi:uncharacterized protein YegL
MTTKKTAKTKATKKVNKKKTYVTIVIDRSGSMSGIQKQTVNGINEQINVIRLAANKGGDTEATIIKFDTVVEHVVTDVKAENLIDWTDADFVPRGGTAMYDATWAALNHLKTKEETDDTGYLVCVISDGEENASVEVSQDILSKEIKRLEATGKWTFAYMLANQDIHSVSAKLNTSLGNMRGFASTVSGSAVAYSANAASVNNYLDLRSKGFTATSNFSNTTTNP